ncbi:MAG: lactate utilization protein C, partial [Methyloligellaceae bacterium]
MSNAQTRQSVLRDIRAALGAGGKDKARKETVRNRLTSHRANLVPKRARKSRRARLELFTGMLEGQAAKVSHAKSEDDVPEIVAAYLRKNNLPAEFRTGSDELLMRIPWDKAPSLTRMRGRGQGSDAVTMTRAQAAAAETGTMFLASGEDNPTTLNFLPDTHIIIIRADDILGSYEDAWNALRNTYGQRTLPRTVNLIS